jgi:PPIC-type PPIASE domain
VPPGVLCYALCPMNQGVFLRTFVGMTGALVGWLAIHQLGEPADGASAAPTPKPSASASGEPATAADPVPVPAATAADVGEGGAASAGGANSGISLNLPALEDAPKSVKFGVVLVQFEGAQGAPKGAPNKDQARKRADELLSVAKEDFDEAVKQGDKGSVANAGKMFRGILEPKADYALFSLEKGDVSEVVVTPRGFWIVKRID